MNKNRWQFNVTLNEEENTLLHKLKEEYNINISGCFKSYLKQKLAEQEKIKKYEK